MNERLSNAWMSSIREFDDGLDDCVFWSCQNPGRKCVESGNARGGLISRTKDENDC